MYATTGSGHFYPVSSFIFLLILRTRRPLKMFKNPSCVVVDFKSFIIVFSLLFFFQTIIILYYNDVSVIISYVSRARPAWMVCVYLSKLVGKILWFLLMCRKIGILHGFSSLKSANLFWSRVSPMWPPLNVKSTNSHTL